MTSPQPPKTKVKVKEPPVSKSVKDADKGLKQKNKAKTFEKYRKHRQKMYEGVEPPAERKLGGQQGKLYEGPTNKYEMSKEAVKKKQRKELRKIQSGKGRLA